LSDFPRPLNPKEKTILDFLLSEPFPGRDELRAQLETVTVSGRCDCGCETIDLSVDGKTVVRAPVKSRTPIHGMARIQPGTHVTLHVVDGMLHELEVCSDEAGPACFPEPSSLELFIP
jgi:hypothetical protein